MDWFDEFFTKGKYEIVPDESTRCGCLVLFKLEYIPSLFEQLATNKFEFVWSVR